MYTHTRKCKGVFNANEFQINCLAPYSLCTGHMLQPGVSAVPASMEYIIVIFSFLILLFSSGTVSELFEVKDGVRRSRGDLDSTHLTAHISVIHKICRHMIHQKIAVVHTYL